MNKSIRNHTSQTSVVQHCLKTGLTRKTGHQLPKTRPGSITLDNTSPSPRPVSYTAENPRRTSGKFISKISLRWLS